VKKLLLLFLLLSASSVQQKTIVFEQPVDAVSVTFASKTDTASLLIGDTWFPLAVEDEQDPTLLESNLVILPESNSQIVMRGDLDRMQVNPITVSTEPVSYEVAALKPLGRPRILKRHQWGADDSFLFSAPTSTASSTSSQAVEVSTNGNASSKRADDCNAAKTNYPGDFQVARTVTHDGNGQKLRWARRYSNDIKVLAVHHTAQKITGDLRSPVQRMRALYAFHANSRGWGDIGYHYLIDEEGTIYEGRSGGENVVGGHVYCGNVGTLGIALMGNFDEEQPTQTQVHALQWLLQDLASTYDIPLNRNVFFHGKNTKTIVRHKDLISTECPGHYMSAAIGQVRNNVIAGTIDNNVVFPTIAKATRTDSRETRLSARLEQAGEAMSRRFFRAKRLVRTAERKNPNDARLQMIERQKNTGSNLQRQRAAETARRRRIAEARRATAAPTRITATSTARATDIDPDALRIRLSYEGSNAEISTTGSATINGMSVTNIRLGREGNNCIAVSAGQTLADGIVRINPGDDVLRIDSWNTAWNRFRGVLECRIVDGELVLINELPLEDYMAGLSEQPDTEHYEKQRAFAIAARSYAAYYMEDGHTKFAGKPYHGSDTGKSFQSYSGVKFEEQNPNWVRAVLDTAHLVVTKDDQTVKTAYFSSDDGRTRSPAENGWHNFPFSEVFSSKPDPWCSGMRLHGHGVGMSGCGAKAQAAEGKSAEQILRYYYPGTVLLNVSSL
jgi:peptidoglycan hydrolase-like amidase